MRDLDLRRSERFQNMLENANINATIQTTVGLVGVSSWYEALSPIKLAAQPIIAAVIAIASGVLQKGRAVAAGMISIAAIRSTPTTLIAMATTIANAMVSISCSRLGEMPLACARSGFIVASSKPDQR